MGVINQLISGGHHPVISCTFKHIFVLLIYVCISDARRWQENIVQPENLKETILGMNAIFCEMNAKNKRVQYRWLSSYKMLYIYNRWTFSYIYIYVFWNIIGIVVICGNIVRMKVFWG